MTDKVKLVSTFTDDGIVLDYFDEDQVSPEDKQIIDDWLASGRLIDDLMTGRLPNFIEIVDIEGNVRAFPAWTLLFKTAAVMIGPIVVIGGPIAAVTGNPQVLDTIGLISAFGAGIYFANRRP